MYIILEKKFDLLVNKLKVKSISQQLLDITKI
jgi:hypothetical protein